MQTSQETHRAGLKFVEVRKSWFSWLRAFLDLRVQIYPPLTSPYHLLCEKTSRKLKKDRDLAPLPKDYGLSQCTKNGVSSNLGICFDVQKWKMDGDGNRLIRTPRPVLKVCLFGEALYHPQVRKPVKLTLRFWATFQAIDDPNCKFEVVSEAINFHIRYNYVFGEVVLNHEVGFWRNRKFSVTITTMEKIAGDESLVDWLKWPSQQSNDIKYKKVFINDNDIRRCNKNVHDDDFWIIANNGAMIECNQLNLIDRSPILFKMLQKDMKVEAKRVFAKLEMSEEGVRALLQYIDSFCVRDAMASADATVMIELLETGHNYDLPTLKNFMIKLLCGKVEAADFGGFVGPETYAYKESDDIEDNGWEEEVLRYDIMTDLENFDSDDYESEGSADGDEGEESSEHEHYMIWISFSNKIRLYLWSFENGCQEVMEKMMELLKRSSTPYKLNKSKMFKELVTRGDPNFVDELQDLCCQRQQLDSNEGETRQCDEDQSIKKSLVKEQLHEPQLEYESLEEETCKELQIFLESLERKGYGDVREKVVTLLKTERSKSKESSLFEELMGRTDYERNLSQVPTNPHANEVPGISTAEDDKDDMMERSKSTQTPNAAPLNNSIDRTQKGSENVVDLDNPIVKIEVDEGSVDDDSRLMGDEFPVDIGDSHFEEEHHMLKYEVESEAEEERSSTQSFSINIDDPVISSGVSTPGPYRQREGTLLVDKTVDIYWKSGGAYLECSLCNYELRFSTYSENGMAEGFKTMELHVREKHKDQAIEMRTRFGERQPHQCTTLGCGALFANQESRDKHEVTHRTCDVCGKQVGGKGMSENRKKVAMLAHKRSHESKRTSNHKEQKASSNKKRKTNKS